jgi:hypothetical protein
MAGIIVGSLFGSFFVIFCLSFCKSKRNQQQSMRRYQYRIEQQRLRMAEDREQEQMNALDNALTMTIDEKTKDLKYKKKKDKFNQRICVVCFEKFKKGAKLKKVVDCKHIFHLSCLSDWIKSRIENPTCPMCNVEMYPSLEDSDGEVNNN